MTSPALVGATTVLVVIVAVFLSYQANTGLPFVPTYAVQVQVPNAAGLIRGNEVRIGGARAGVVSDITPLIRPDGAVGAVLHLELETSLGRLPRDTTVRVRPRSPLGLKYVELTRGRSARTVPGGGTLALATGTERPVEIDDVFGMFDPPTRSASAANLDAFGTGFAGRGEDLNRALAGLGPLVRRLEPVARNLADPRTRLDRLFAGLEQAAAEVAPVAAEQGRLFVSLDRTFGALAGAGDAIRDSISAGPAALDTATRELRAQAPFVVDSTALLRRLRPGFTALAAAAPGLAGAERAGTPALRRAPALNRRLTGTFGALERFVADARVAPALDRLTATATLLGPTIAFVTPAQTRCNYLALFFRNLSSALSESDSVGSFLRTGILALPQGPDSEAGPSAAAANGPPLRDSLHDDSFLHANPYPNTAAPGQVAECEAGNERYAAGRQVIGNQPGNQGTANEPTRRRPR